MCLQWGRLNLVADCSTPESHAAIMSGAQVAERAVGLLHGLVWAGHRGLAGPSHAALCGAVCAGRAHQPLLALVYAHSGSPAAAKVQPLRL